MLQPLIDALLRFLSDSVGFAAGSEHFYVVLGVALAAALIVGRLFCGLFGSSRGVVCSALAVGLPLLAAILGYVSVEVYVLPHLTDDWASVYLPWTGFALLGLATALVLSGRFWDLGRGLSLIIMSFAVAAGVAGHYGSHLVIDVLSKGEKNLDERNERIQEELESST